MMVKPTKLSTVFNIGLLDIYFNFSFSEFRAVSWHRGSETEKLPPLSVEMSRRATTGNYSTNWPGFIAYGGSTWNLEEDYITIRYFS